MPVIKPTCVRDLKLRVNLADVVSRMVTLRKAGGARLKGLCPFHNEKTPSFNVDPDKGYYHCFGCGKSGDIISFVRETEQLNFSEAVEALGKRFGIPIEYEEGSGGPSNADRTLRQEVFDLHDAAAEHFYQAFKAKDATGEAMRVLWTEKRRFSPEIADEFKIGAADATGSGLGAAMMRRKFSEEALRRCGLFFIYDDAAITLQSLRPRFRGRLMIPIRDHQGRVCAFTARQTDLTPDDDPAKDAKYVNSPETPIFTKGNLLFNLDRARTAVGKPSPFQNRDDMMGEAEYQPWPFVMVEGQLDAIRCWSVGLKTAIAPQGTAITESQLVLLRRYHSKVECLFDSDSAGQKAALRLLPMALRAGIEIRFLKLGGNGKIDPDLLFLEQGLAAYDDLRRNAQSTIEFASHAFLPNPKNATVEQQSSAARSLVEIIASSESEVTRAKLLAEAARHLSMLPKVVSAEFASFLQRQSRQSAARPAANQPDPVPTAPHTSHTPERDLLLICLHFESIGKPLSLSIPHDWIDLGHPAGALLNRFLGEFEHDLWPGKDHLENLLESDAERSLVASLLFETPGFEEPTKVAQEGLKLLRARALEPRLREIELALANPHADIESDPISLLKERSELHRLLRQPIALAASA